MNPDANKTPGLGLPSPLMPQDNPGQIDPGAASLPVPMQSQQPQVAVPQAMAVQDVVGDDDTLDQEWVNKAKAVIEGTRNDPFLESRELSKVKADYLKSRYNKQIKLSEEHN